MTTTEIFGEVISSYTRAQAIEDGQQFDVSSDPGAVMYQTPVFVTASLQAFLVKGQGSDAHTYSARLHDVCYMVAKFGQPQSSSTREASVKIGARRVLVHGEVGAADIDDPTPAITLGLREDF